MKGHNKTQKNRDAECSKDCEETPLVMDPTWIH